MRDFSLPLTVRSAQYAAGRVIFFPRVIPQNNTGERGASVYIGKKTVKNRRSFKNKKHFGGGFFDSGFLQCLGVVATSNEKPECEKNSGFIYAIVSVNGSNNLSCLGAPHPFIPFSSLLFSFFSSLKHQNLCPLVHLILIR